MELVLNGHAQEEAPPQPVFELTSEEMDMLRHQLLAIEMMAILSMEMAVTLPA